MKTVWKLAGIGGCLLLLSVVGSWAVTNTIHVFNFDFGLSSNHVDPTNQLGDTIQWVWDDTGGITHSTTAAAGQLESWDSGLQSNPFTFSHTFTQVGKFGYYCHQHGFDDGGGNVSGMSGHVYILSGPWFGATDLSGGWLHLDWFGDFATNSTPWIYHAQHGWLYAQGTDTQSVYFWDNSQQAWWWTSNTSYPYLYRFSDGAWLFYQIGSTGPRWFYNFKTMKWESV